MAEANSSSSRIESLITFSSYSQTSGSLGWYVLFAVMIPFTFAAFTDVDVLSECDAPFVCAGDRTVALAVSAPVLGFR